MTEYLLIIAGIALLIGALGALGLIYTGYRLGRIVAGQDNPKPPKHHPGGQPALEEDPWREAVEGVKEMVR